MIALAASAAAAGTIYFSDATGAGKVKPRTLNLTADGTLDVGHATWSSWGGAAATGSGTAYYHGCTPNCAAGKQHTAHVAIRLSGIKTCAGRSYYKSVRLTLPSGKLLDSSYLRQVSYAPCR